VFNRKGEMLGKAQQEFKQIYPKAGWVEHDPNDILGSQVGVIAEALIRAGVGVDEVEAIGISNQRETTLVWDKRTGVPVYNAIVWQCRRTADMCDQLKAQGLSDFIYDKTGLIIDAYFSATKIKWILDNVDGARERAERGELAFGTVDTYLMYKLSKGEIFATDYTNASRTMLFNIHTLEWDEELLKLFDIPRSMLPQVYPSAHLYGVTDKNILGRQIPICAVAGDQQAALFGHLCTNKGDIKNTYGTGCFLLMNTGDKPVNCASGLLTSIGASADDKITYVLEGSIFVGGAVVQWLRDELQIIRTAEESELYATKVKDTGGVYIVPAFTGLGAPYWDAHARGTIVGITRGTRKEHIIRASLEAIAYEVCDVVEAMQKEAGIKISGLRVDGGASVNNFLMSFQADLLGCDVERPAVCEATAQGVAYLAGLKCGYWKDVDEIRKNAANNIIFKPQMSEQDRKNNLNGWEKAVRQARLK
jgi:glycerol kinase